MERSGRGDEPAHPAVAMLTADEVRAAIADLVGLLQATVDGGASLGFLAPLAEPEATAYWESVAGEVSTGSRLVLVVRDGPGGRIVGSGQLGFVARPNGRHRAELAKVMVLPSHRGRGIARRIVARLERLARDRGIALLVLDTSEGPGGARGFYEVLGYVYAGGIPGWALDPDGTPAKNAIFYKVLG